MSFCLHFEIDVQSPLENEDKCRIFAYCVLCDLCICTLLYVTKVASRKSRTKLCRCPKLTRYPDYKAEQGPKPKKRTHTPVPHTLNIPKKVLKCFATSALRTSTAPHQKITKVSGL